MSKVVKGVKNVVKKIGKTVKKTFKAVTKSTVGKVLLGAAAIYFTGGALGLWGGGAGGAAGAGAGLGGVGGGAAMGAGMGASQGAAAALQAMGAGTGAGATVGQVGLSAAANLSAGATTGILSKIGGIAKGAWDVAKNADPLVQSTVLQGIASATAPDEIDVMREQDRLQQQEDERRRRNYNVSGVNLGLAPRAPGVQQPLRDQYGNLVYNSSGRANETQGATPGIIARRMM